MMFSVTKEVQFDAGHRVPHHASKCRNPHGHRYRVVVEFTGELVDTAGASDEGMVVDFGELAELLRTEVHDRWDHGMVVWEHDADLLGALANHGWKVVPVAWVPTAENMAHDVFTRLDAVCGHDFNDRVRVRQVQVYETPTSVAMVTA